LLLWHLKTFVTTNNYVNYISFNNFKHKGNRLRNVDMAYEFWQVYFHCPYIFNLQMLTIDTLINSVNWIKLHCKDLRYKTWSKSTQQFLNNEMT
jgi:hypothetical protein